MVFQGQAQALVAVAGPYEALPSARAVALNRVRMCPRSWEAFARAAASVVGVDERMAIRTTKYGPLRPRITSQVSVRR